MEIRIDLTNKTVLEIGSGRGNTTRQLVALLAQYPNTRLVVTDASSQFFSELQCEFEKTPVELRFVCTDACQLADIENNSVDLLVCNYTLCAINSNPGKAALALRRFCEVLHPGGWISIEEEFPIHSAHTPLQEVWAEKWRILKAATLLTGGAPYTEFSPETLSRLCSLTGYKSITWEEDLAKYPPDALDFFYKRVLKLVPDLPNPSLRAGFQQWASELLAKAHRLGGMEIPYYRLVAWKPAADT